MIVHNELKSSAVANWLDVGVVNILVVSSRRKMENDVNNNDDDLLEIDDIPLETINICVFVVDICVYIAGFVEESILKDINFDTCINLLLTEKEICNADFINIKMMDNLHIGSYLGKIPLKYVHMLRS